MKKNRAGGVTLYCMQFLDAEIVTQLSRVSTCLECVFGKISIAGKLYLIGSLSKPPSCTYSIFIEEF